MKINQQPQIAISNDAVTIVIVHDVQAQKHSLYDKVMEELIAELKEQKGFLSVDILKPLPHTLRYVAIMRFLTEKNAHEWLQHPKRLEILKPVEPWLLDGDQHHIETDPDFWFKPNPKPPKMWKRFISSWIAVLPLALTIPAFYVWLIQDILNWSTFWIGLPISLTISWLMTYFTMPYITKHLADWLSR